MLEFPSNSPLPTPVTSERHVDMSEQVDGEYIDTEVMYSADYRNKNHSTEMKGLLL